MEKNRNRKEDFSRLKRGIRCFKVETGNIKS